MKQQEQILPESGVTHKIIGAAMEVHGQLGCGFLESVYEEAMDCELGTSGLKYERQKPINIYYKEKMIKQFIVDLVVEDKVIVELKAIKALTDIEKAQVINYLKASEYEIGLLLNFGSKSLECKRYIFSNPRNQ